MMESSPENLLKVEVHHTCFPVDNKIFLSTDIPNKL